ncbi:unnamed protein product [Calypogeia fissa]
MELVLSTTACSLRYCSGRQSSSTRVVCANDGLFVSNGSAERRKLVVKCARGGERANSVSHGRIELQKTLLFFHTPKTTPRNGQQRYGWVSRAPKRKTYFVKSFDGRDYGDLNDSSLPPALDEVLEYLSVQKQEETVVSDNAYLPHVEERRIPDPESGVQEGYVGLFVRLLGLDNPVEDREDAVQALWRHSAGGKEFIDQIVEFPGCLNLIVSLLPSDRPASAEAAAGLLRNISSVNAYRSAVAEAGALEEIAGLLTRRSICAEVKEQATCVLWNLSVEEGPRKKLVQPEILQVLMAMLGSDIVGEREASAGVLANLTLSPSSHETLVDAGLIPKLARILLSDKEESKVARQEARNALLELTIDQHVKLLIIEEGLVPVPSIGASAYRSFKPLLQVAPALPESVKVKRPTSKVESKFGAGELLLGLSLENPEIDDATRLNIEGKVRQQFLARIGLLGKTPAKSDRIGHERITLLPWWDGIPRLILILGLDDLTVARQAALAIADIAINEENRQAVHKGGAIPQLVRLLGSGDEDSTAAATFALDKLAISHQIRQSINAHDAPSAMVAILKAEDAPDYVKEKVVGALFRLSQTGEEVEEITRAGAIPGLIDIVRSDNASVEAKEEAEEVLEEMSNLKADPRDKIIAAGGVQPLIDIVMNGSPGQAEGAICVLENIVTEGPNAKVIMEANVESALKFLLDVDFPEGLVEMRDGKGISKEDGYMLIGAAARLLEKLARYEMVNVSVFAPLLTNVLQSEAPLKVKDWVSACLLKLEQVSKGRGFKLEVPLDLEVTIHDTIPWLVTEIGEDFSPTVRERAVMHLRHLITQGMSTYAAAIANSGGILPLVNLLKVGSSDARDAAIAILYNLSMNEDNHPPIMAAGVVPCLVELIRSGVPEWKLALYLLRALPS